MPDISDQLVTILPYLRRYARALVGDQQIGDTYVRICLETLIQEPARVRAGPEARVQLYALFHEVFTRTGVRDASSDTLNPSDLTDLTVESRLRALPPTERQALLLTTLEGFSVSQTAEILKVPESTAADLIADAWSLVNPRLRMLKRLLASSPQDRARLAESRPLAALPLRERKPFLTFALLGVLAAVFVAEFVFPATPATGFWTPSVSTLVALGALAKPLVLGQGEWHRLLTAAFLHGGPVHLLFNGLALWMAGMVLEPLLGRAWLIALFFIGALGGSLMSLAINPPNIVSVGASGAIMALLAAATVVAFRLPDGAERNRVLQGLLRILIPSLIPLATVRSGTRVDFAAHLGGALIGFASGGALLALWPRASPRPRLQGAAAAVAVLGLAALGWSADKVRTGYTSYATERLLIPANQLPKTEDELVSSGPRLVAAYPRDPRSRLFNAVARLRARDLAGAEAELRLALGEKQILKTWFKRDLEVRIRTLLAQTLIEQHRAEDARLDVQPVCDAGPGGTPPEQLKAMKLCP